MSKKHRAGFVSIIGNPNVGKSTFLNSWVGEDASIVTPKSQTTRHRIRFIINSEDYQIVLSDTPGLIEPKYQLQNSMMKFLKDTLIDSDILLLMTTVGDKIKENEIEPDFVSALKLCKRRRIGPLRPESNRELFYKKDMGILARGGFSFDLSKRVLDLDTHEFNKLIKLI